MSLFPTASRDGDETARRKGWRVVLHPFRGIKKFLPRGLFWRSLIIIVAPVVLLQAIVTYVFFERHYDIVTRHLARGVAGDVAFLTTLEESEVTPVEKAKVVAMASTALGYTVTMVPGEVVSYPVTKPADAFDHQLQFYLNNVMGRNIDFETSHYSRSVEVRVEVAGGVLRIVLDSEALQASNSDIFVLWMLGSSLILLAVAILFLRNQVRPIERLAYAAENFGKGRHVEGFKPAGATEVRRAAQAFIVMRERIERYVQQRTEMLAGVSHDMKTPLTRMRLELAMMGDQPAAKAMISDLDEMEHMLNGYLDFARGAGGEVAERADLYDVVEEAVANASRGHEDRPQRITLKKAMGITVSIKRNALKRCIANLIENALKYGKHVEVALKRTERGVDIIIDDDGPGIPEPRREEAFRPFHRLDVGRNLQAGGVGLGLAIARDIARGHGGDLVLDTSPLGGLRAIIRLPE
jgi:two-component system osmolarity sensor histidine kinase EnvZ